jgi:hypothetical protein
MDLAVAKLNLAGCCDVKKKKIRSNSLNEAKKTRQTKYVEKSKSMMKIR